MSMLRQLIFIVILLTAISYAKKFELPEKKRLTPEDIAKLIIPEKQEEDFTVQTGYQKLALDIQNILKEKFKDIDPKLHETFEQNVFKAKQELKNSKFKVDERIAAINKVFKPVGGNEEKK
eukprot:gene10758-3377_t